MKKFILDYVCAIEGWKTAIKSLHWDASNMSQHKLCDDIAAQISDFQDTVSEVEQGLHGKLSINKLHGTAYDVKELKKFINDVIKETFAFYKKLNTEEYIGLKSEVETFIALMQKNLYLVDFTIKEDFKRNFKKKINESNNHVGKNRVSLTESELKDVIREALKNVISRIK